MSIKQNLSLICAILAILSSSVCAVRADEQLPDPCKLAPESDIAALITPASDIEVRQKSEYPVPGEATCLWSVFQKGLTADAPPEGEFALAYYHLASPAAAIAQMRRLAKTAQPPGLVRTQDPDDQVLRTDADTVVTRHGSDIVVTNTSETTPAARERAGWAYRVENAALTAVGSHVLGPADARATAPVCQLVKPEHVIALLTLSPSTLEASSDPSDDGRRCRFDVKDGSGTDDGWTKNDGDAQFTLDDLGNNAAALARLKSDRPFDPPSTLVRTNDPTDRVVATPDHPEEVEAVHGPYIITLNLDGMTAQARAHPTWVYRVQRTALEAAGAKIVADTNATPDPVTPGPVPAPTPTSAPQGTDFDWPVQAHAAPSWSVYIDPLLALVAFFARHRFMMAPVLIVGSLLFSGIFSSNSIKGSKPAIIGYEPEPPKRKRFIGLVPLFIGIAIINIIFGADLSGLLIYNFGAEGRAVITGSYATSTQYNNHDVVGYNVLIKAADGRIVETTFEDDDFNVYPSHNETSYPGIGDRFNVRYIQHSPKDFVILGEDDSPWAQGLRCAKLQDATAQAEEKLKFAPNEKTFQQAVADAQKTEVQAGCSQ